MEKLSELLWRAGCVVLCATATLVAVPLSAEASPSLISVSPLTVDIGSIGFHDFPTVTFAITNIADGDVWVTAAYRGSEQSVFPCQEGALPGRSPYIIHPGDTCSIAMNISVPVGAIGPGQTIIDFSAQSGAQVVTATVTWNALTPLVTVDPTPISVAPTQVGQTTTQTLTLTNNSDVAIAIGVQVGGSQQTDCNGMFDNPSGAHGPVPVECTMQLQQGATTLSISEFSCDSVAAHHSCPVVLTYTPKIALPTVGGLLVYSGDFQTTIPITTQAMPVQSIAGTVLAVEFIEKGLLHFFVTAIPGEIAALDAGQFPGWFRTGRSFWVYPSGAPIAPGESPVCRYFTMPTSSFQTHFYSAFPQECNSILTLFPGVWTFETDDAFGVQQPNVATGACPSGTSPLYRLYNGLPNVNHRYVTDLGTRQLMLDDGWIPEGYGPLGVGMCVPQ